MLVLAPGAGAAIAAGGVDAAEKYRGLQSRCRLRRPCLVGLLWTPRRLPYLLQCPLLAVIHFSRSTATNPLSLYGKRYGDRDPLTRSYLHLDRPIQLQSFACRIS